MTEQRLKIAVFVDFDNIEIGVKTTLNKHFDIGVVLEAIKERGEVVTKIAYGDWKRAGEESRSMTQHAVQMVQRNLTPGGDKNGADINLALDALEMAFTRNHINAFVIVGGDSDFITLVEKLKQYDKTVFVVGGRAFTSAILQKNCHEFIAYENLIGIHDGARKTAGKARTASPSGLQDALPLVRRALKILADREVSPQLGLLKSTLLQLDSTFSERDFGASTFRELMRKMADAGLLNLKQVDRSLIVETKETEVSSLPQAQERLQVAEGVRKIQEIFGKAGTTARWPMYVRHVKPFLKKVEPGFDEKVYGFKDMLDAVRHAQREGLFRLENRQGVLRVFPGDKISQPPVQEGISAVAGPPGAQGLVAAEAPVGIQESAFALTPPAAEVKSRRRAASKKTSEPRRPRALKKKTTEEAV